MAWKARRWYALEFEGTGNRLLSYTTKANRDLAILGSRNEQQEDEPPENWLAPVKASAARHRDDFAWAREHPRF